MMKIRRTKTPRIQAESVVKAALEILDAEGLEHVTFRRLAAKLGVQAPALYWYFEDKQDIIDDMAQAILTTDKLNDISAPKDIGDWASWLTDLAHSVRDALISHREGGRVVAGASFFRAYAVARMTLLIIRVLNEAGFDTLQATMAARTIFDYVWGFVIEEQTGPGPEPEPMRVDIKEAPIDKIGLENADFLYHIMEERSKLTDTGEFDWGLQVIINGLKLTLEKK
jgi:TetR/AcrR family tetracycline transcriptional repressor